MTDDLDADLTRRAFAIQELRGLGIEPSPADLAAWLSFGPRERDRAKRDWVLNRTTALLTATP
jgi:hypothetical protein